MMPIRHFTYAYPMDESLVARRAIIVIITIVIPPSAYQTNLQICDCPAKAKLGATGTLLCPTTLAARRRPLPASDRHKHLSIAPLSERNS